MRAKSQDVQKKSRENSSTGGPRARLGKVTGNVARGPGEERRANEFQALLVSHVSAIGIFTTVFQAFRDIR